MEITELTNKMFDITEEDGSRSYRFNKIKALLKQELSKPTENKDRGQLHTHFCYKCYGESFKHFGCKLESNSKESTPSCCAHGKNYPVEWTKQEISKPEDAKVSNIYMVKAKFFAEKDCFGESYVVTSENTQKDLRLEVGTIVILTAEKNRVSPYAHKSKNQKWMEV